VIRRVKLPGLASAITPTTIFQYLANTIAIQTVTGTPGATPALPNVPGDSSGIFNIPLAMVLVPNGFGAASTVVVEDIRDVAPVLSFANNLGGAMQPASDSHDLLETSGGSMVVTPGQYATDAAFQWNLVTPHRSTVFLPPSMIGKVEVFADIDVIVSAHPSHISTGIIDRSIDWRKRFFRVSVCGSLSAIKFANDATAASAAVPTLKQVITGAGSSSWNDFVLSNSFIVDAQTTTTDASVYFADNTSSGGVIAGGAKIGIYVNHTDGTLRFWFSGSPAVRLFAWIEASAPMPNNNTSLP
jgi:hypothetical protein